MKTQELTAIEEAQLTELDHLRSENDRLWAFAQRCAQEVRALERRVHSARKGRHLDRDQTRAMDLCIRGGMNNEQIARALSTSPVTVRNHRKKGT